MNRTLAIVVAALTACSSMEREAGPDAARAFRSLDRNGDGYITRDEARRDDAVARGFEMADRNGDGKLEPEEFRMVPR
jgi:Ca2+-binding EF-hand superfamily protein